MEAEDVSGDQSAKLLMPPRQRPLIRVSSLGAKSKWRRILWGGVYAFVFGSGKTFIRSVDVFFVVTVKIETAIDNRILERHIVSQNMSFEKKEKVTSL